MSQTQQSNTTATTLSDYGQPREIPKRDGAPRHRDFPSSLNECPTWLLEAAVEHGWTAQDIADDLGEARWDVLKRLRSHNLEPQGKRAPEGRPEYLWQHDPEELYDWQGDHA